MKAVIIILAIVAILFLGIWNCSLVKKVGALRKVVDSLKGTKDELDVLKDSIVELRDKKPSGKSTKTSKAMKLSNEITPYIKEDGDEIFIKVLK